MPDVQFLPAIIEPDDIGAGKKEYRVITRVKNNLLLTAIERAGYASVAEFAEKIQICPSRLGTIINFKDSPLEKNGDWRPIVHRICEALNKMPIQLFTERQMHIRNAEIKTAEVSEAEAFLALENSSTSDPQSLLETKEMQTVLGAALETLSPRYKEVIKLFYGLEEAPLLFTEIGERLNITGGRVAQIHELALRKLRRHRTITMLEAVKTI